MKPNLENIGGNSNAQIGRGAFSEFITSEFIAVGAIPAYKILNFIEAYNQKNKKGDRKFIFQADFYIVDIVSKKSLPS